MPNSSDEELVTPDNNFTKSFEVEFESAECCHSAEDYVKCILSSFLLNLCSGGCTVAIFHPIFDLLFTHFLLNRVVHSSHFWLLFISLAEESTKSE